MTALLRSEPPKVDAGPGVAMLVCRIFNGFGRITNLAYAKVQSVSVALPSKPTNTPRCSTISGSVMEMGTASRPRLPLSENNSPQKHVQTVLTNEEDTQHKLAQRTNASF